MATNTLIRQTPCNLSACEAKPQEKNHTQAPDPDSKGQKAQIPLLKPTQISCHSNAFTGQRLQIPWPKQQNLNTTENFHLWITKGKHTSTEVEQGHMQTNMHRQAKQTTIKEGSSLLHVDNRGPTIVKKQGVTIIPTIKIQNLGSPVCQTQPNSRITTSFHILCTNQPFLAKTIL